MTLFWTLFIIILTVYAGIISYLYYLSYKKLISEKASFDIEYQNKDMLINEMVSQMIDAETIFTNKLNERDSKIDHQESIIADKGNKILDLQDKVRQMLSPAVKNFAEEIEMKIIKLETLSRLNRINALDEEEFYKIKQQLIDLIKYGKTTENLTQKSEHEIASNIDESETAQTHEFEIETETKTEVPDVQELDVPEFEIEIPKTEDLI